MQWFRRSKFVQSAGTSHKQACRPFGVTSAVPISATSTCLITGISLCVILELHRRGVGCGRCHGAMPLLKAHADGARLHSQPRPALWAKIDEIRVFARMTPQGPVAADIFATNWVGVGRPSLDRPRSSKSCRNSQGLHNPVPNARLHDDGSVCILRPGTYSCAETAATMWEHLSRRKLAEGEVRMG